MRWSLAAVLALVVLLEGCLGGEHRIEAGKTATLRVIVVDIESAPVAGARVALLDSFASESTTEEGVAVIAGLRPGFYNVSVSRFGFERAYAEVWIEGTGETSVSVTLQPTKPPRLNYYLWTQTGSCSRGPTTASACGASATASTPPPTKEPPWPKDLYNVSITLNWTGILSQMEFEIVFGEDLPLRDGRIAVNVSGPSSLVFDLDPENISKAMRRPGPAPTIRAVRPVGPSPSQYHQPFSSTVRAWYRDPSPLAAFPVNTTVYEDNFTLPRSAPAIVVTGGFNITYADEVTEVRARLRYDCPYRSTGAYFRVFDPSGRNFTERFPDYGPGAGYQFCVPGETQAFVLAGRQVLWDLPGPWRFESGGQCECRLWVQVIREDWPGMGSA